MQQEQQEQQAGQRLIAAEPPAEEGLWGEECEQQEQLEQHAVQGSARVAAAMALAEEIFAGLSTALLRQLCKHIGLEVGKGNRRRLLQALTSHALAEDAAGRQGRQEEEG